MKPSGSEIRTWAAEFARDGVDSLLMADKRGQLALVLPGLPPRHDDRVIDTPAIARQLTDSSLLSSRVDAITDALREAAEDGDHLTRRGYAPSWPARGGLHVALRLHHVRANAEHPRQDLIVHHSAGPAHQRDVVACRDGAAPATWKT